METEAGREPDDARARAERRLDLADELRHVGGGRVHQHGDVPDEAEFPALGLADHPVHARHAEQRGAAIGDPRADRGGDRVLAATHQVGRGRGLRAGDQVSGLEGGPHPLVRRCRRRGPRAQRGGGRGEHGEPHAVDRDPRAVDGQHRADAAKLLEPAQVVLGEPAGHGGDHVRHHQVRRGRARKSRLSGRCAGRLPPADSPPAGTTRPFNAPAAVPSEVPPAAAAPPAAPEPPDAVPADDVPAAAFVRDRAVSEPPAAVWPPLSTATVAATAAPTATSPPATVGSDWRRINGSLTVTQPYRSEYPRVTAISPRVALLAVISVAGRADATHLTVSAGTPPGTATLRL